MKRLILFRHAETQSGADSGEDIDRALTPRGHVDAAEIGRSVAAAGLIPDLVLVSAARRAVQTWAAAAPVLPDAQVQTRLDLYAASAGDLRAAADAAGAARVVMLVAHNPGLQVLAQSLADDCALIGAADRARFAEGLPAGAAAAFELDGERIGCLGLFLPGGRGDADRREGR